MPPFEEVHLGKKSIKCISRTVAFIACTASIFVAFLRGIKQECTWGRKTPRSSRGWCQENRLDNPKRTLRMILPVSWWNWFKKKSNLSGYMHINTVYIQCYLCYTNHASLGCFFSFRFDCFFYAKRSSFRWAVCAPEVLFSQRWWWSFRPRFGFGFPLPRKSHGRMIFCWGNKGKDVETGTFTWMSGGRS